MFKFTLSISKLMLILSKALCCQVSKPCNIISAILGISDITMLIREYHRTTLAFSLRLEIGFIFQFWLISPFSINGCTSKEKRIIIYSARFNPHNVIVNVGSHRAGARV